MNVMKFDMTQNLVLRWTPRLDTSNITNIKTSVLCGNV